MLRNEFFRNAWLVQPDKFSYFLEKVFENHWGEIWLYNNDLAVFYDHHLFGELYLKLIDGTLKHNIDAIKLLLPEELYIEFSQQSNENLMRNLARLSNKRLSTLYIGQLDQATPAVMNIQDPSDTWIFYTTYGGLSADTGVVMFRHNVYPFAEYVKGQYCGERIAVCWMLRDQNTLKQRLEEEVFQQCFENHSNFKWINVVGRNPFQIELKEGPSEETKRHRKIRDRPSKSLSIERDETIDVAIFTALADELHAFERLIKRKIPLTQKTRQLLW